MSWFDAIAGQVHVHVWVCVADKFGKVTEQRLSLRLPRNYTETDIQDRTLASLREKGLLALSLRIVK